MPVVQRLTSLSSSSSRRTTQISQRPASLTGEQRQRRHRFSLMACRTMWGFPRAQERLWRAIPSEFSRSTFRFYAHGGG